MFKQQKKYSIEYVVHVLVKINKANEDHANNVNFHTY